MQKTSLFLDQLSYSSELRHFSVRVASFGMAEQFMYVPAYVFKKFCADVRKANLQFPSLFRDLWQEQQINLDLYSRLFKIKSNSKDTDSALVQPAANEKYSLDTHCLDKRSFLIDILPSVYQILHPTVREINIQLFTEWERTVFLAALEFMVVFNIKLKIAEEQTPVDGLPRPETGIPQFEPDLASLVVFGSGRPKSLPYGQRARAGFGNADESKSKAKRVPMRRSVQILLM
jgi:hypothetical protein